MQERDLLSGERPDPFLPGGTADALSAIVENAGDGLYVMGADTRCTYLNPAGARTLGYAAGELVGRALHDIVHHTHPDGRPHSTSPHARAR